MSKIKGRRAAYPDRQLRVIERMAARAGAFLPLPEIYVGLHRDESGTRFYSVNFFDGEAGWQSGPFYSFADTTAEVRRVKNEVRT
jgi:aminoglycoside phosphotransferase (APT) family kinase protein